MMLKDVMTRNIQTVGVQESIRQAATLMRDLDVGILPVQDEDKLVGTLTDRDIAVRGTAAARDPEATKVGDVMTQGVLFGYEDDEAGTAVQTMEKEQVRRLIVLDHDNQCVGIVSMGDIALRSGDPNLSEELLEEVSKPAA